ncbi:hypothetical protein Plhal304r1_c019g0068431 [Plasmopara halstedii]
MQNIVNSSANIAAPSLVLGVLDTDLDVWDFVSELDYLQHKTYDCRNVKRQHENFNNEPIVKKMRVETPLDTTQTKQTTSRNRQSTSWSRRKQELQYLRCEAEALETYMIFLQMDINQQKTLSQPNDIEDQGMWKAVAIIAQQECENAQRENSRLKHEIQMYARASDMVQRHLLAAMSWSKELLKSSWIFADTSCFELAWKPQLSVDRDQVFHRLETRINERLLDIDLILYESHDKIEESTFEQVHACRDGGQDGATAIEFKHARLLPFDEDITAESVWKVVKSGKIVTQTNTHLAKSTSDMIAYIAQHNVPLSKSTNVRVEVHTVVKRFPASNGLIALVESQSEWSFENVQSSLAQSTTEEGGWVMVHEYPQKVLAETQQASQLRTLFKLRPKEYQIEGKVTSLSSAVVDFIIPSYREILCSLHHWCRSL